MNVTDLDTGVVQRSQSIEGIRVLKRKKGYDPAYGARPMAKVIQNEIKTPLVDEILFGKLRYGGKVEISIKNGALEFQYINSR